MPNLGDAYYARLDACKERGIDPYGADDTVFGTGFVFCHQHLRPHSTGWCTVSNADKTPLSGATLDEATAEVRAKGWRIYGDPVPCVHCGRMVDRNGRVVEAQSDATAEEDRTRCPQAPRSRPWHATR